MKAFLVNLVASAGLLLIALLVSAGCGMYGMFQPHDYDWGTGQPSLNNQVITFYQAKKGWPNNYRQLAEFMKQSDNKFVPFSYDRIDFITKPDGNLEIVVYTFESGTTNRITLRAP